MHSQVGKAWTLSGLSSAIGMSRAVFVERFTRLVGEPPNTYLRRVRMHRAATRLEDTMMPSSRLPLPSGYQSESSFNKAFSRKWESHRRAIADCTSAAPTCHEALQERASTREVRRPAN